ncbi:MAG: mandelate racemase [Pseudomonadota bacterium]|nr:MAG: mandelate racemase [Pseudomonadota bacterium]
MTAVISAIKTTPVLVPFKRPPVTASGSVNELPLVLLDVETDAGITGHAYLFVFLPSMLKPTVDCVAAVEELVQGMTADPEQADPMLRKRLRLLDIHGILGQVLAGLDMALWDIQAKTRELPLAQVLGQKRDAMQTYNSCGLWLEKGDPEKLAEQAQELLAEGGFNAVKLRLGYESFDEDLAAVRAVKRRCGDSVDLMSDFNQGLDQDEALRRCQGLDGEGLYWMEEPVRYDDYHGSAAIAVAVDTPIQTGENLLNPLEFQKAMQAGAADYYMFDVQRIAGVSGWLRTAELPGAADTPVSTHLFPEISIHIMAATDNAHWLEYVDWASPVIRDPVVPSNGEVQVPTTVGNGIAWNDEAVERYRVD